MEITSQGCLLRKEDSGENHFLMVFFLRESGLINVLARKPTRSSASILLPDLFETGWLILQQKEAGKFAFLKEFEPESAFPGIALNYERLKTAASLSKFYERNLIHMETFNDAWDLLMRSLQALSTRPRPDLILFKTLYLLARSEGYPVASAWINSLPSDTRNAAKHALTHPPEEVEEDSHQVHDWIRHLNAFFKSETDLLPPQG